MFKIHSEIGAMIPPRDMQIKRKEIVIVIIEFILQKNDSEIIKSNIHNSNTIALIMLLVFFMMYSLKIILWFNINSDKNYSILCKKRQEKAPRNFLNALHKLYFKAIIELFVVNVYRFIVS